jgi:hypothetical protein
MAAVAPNADLRAAIARSPAHERRQMTVLDNAQFLMADKKPPSDE